MLCHREAYRFYNERTIPLSGSKWVWNRSLGGSDGSSNGEDGKTTCATLVEVFAKPENDLKIPEGVGKEDKVHCRNITMELAACMARKRK